ncbi:hypothetical protein HMPREF2615_26280 [Pseudomonas aeruginosa]|nr:hypothetical protein HMPREF2615_26280 [Pseudomonas aeruginosa]
MILLLEGVSNDGQTAVDDVQWCKILCRTKSGISLIQLGLYRRLKFFLGISELKLDLPAFFFNLKRNIASGVNAQISITFKLLPAIFSGQIQAVLYRSGNGANAGTSPRAVINVSACRDSCRVEVDKVSNGSCHMYLLLP